MSTEVINLHDVFVRIPDRGNLDEFAAALETALISDGDSSVVIHNFWMMGVQKAVRVFTPAYVEFVKQVKVNAKFRTTEGKNLCDLLFDKAGWSRKKLSYYTSGYVPRVLMMEPGSVFIDVDKTIGDRDYDNTFYADPKVEDVRQMIVAADPAILIEKNAAGESMLTRLIESTGLKDLFYTLSRNYGHLDEEARIKCFKRDIKSLGDGPLSPIAFTTSHMQGGTKRLAQYLHELGKYTKLYAGLDDKGAEIRGQTNMFSILCSRIVAEQSADPKSQRDVLVATAEVYTDRFEKNALVQLIKTNPRLYLPIAIANPELMKPVEIVGILTDSQLFLKDSQAKNMGDVLLKFVASIPQNDALGDWVIELYRLLRNRENLGQRACDPQPELERLLMMNECKSDFWAARHEMEYSSGYSAGSRRA
jgi:hypothetical protein